MSIATIMAHLEVGRPNHWLLDAAARLAERFNAHVIGIGVCQPVQLLYGDVYVAGDLIQLDREEIDREEQVAEDEFRAALAGKARSLSWRGAATIFPLSEFIADQARAADLIITSPDTGGTPFESTRRTDIGNLVMQAGRPVLIAPPDAAPLDLGHVVVAWKDTRESRRASLDALPLLAVAGAVTVVEVAETSDLAHAQRRVADVVGWLERQGIKAVGETVTGQGDVTAQLDGIAESKGAGLVVAGAYGHTRLREWAFGGVSKQLLMHPRRCTLVSH